MPTLHKIYLRENTHVTINPATDLWTLKQIHRVASWPMLPIGLNHKLVECEYHLVRAWAIDVDKCYMVIRKANNRVIKFNRKFYENSI